MPSKNAPIFVRLQHNNKRMYIILGNNNCLQLPSSSSSKCMVYSIVLQPCSLTTTVIYKTISKTKFHSFWQADEYTFYNITWIGMQSFKALTPQMLRPHCINTLLQLNCTKIPNWWKEKPVQKLTNWHKNILQLALLECNMALNQLVS
jgi:hypothetical protein